MVSSKRAFFYCTLLAFQFGLQPLISSRYTPIGVNPKTIVIGTELIKVIISLIIISLESKEVKQNIINKFTLMNSLKRAALPASLYSVQNLFVQYGLKLMDNMTFNLLNQTKTLSAAFFLYIFLGKKQSFIQIIALFLLLGAAYVLNMDNEESREINDNLELYAQYNLGVILVLGSSVISGLSATLTQKALVETHPIFFSFELAIYGISFMIYTIMINPTERLLFFHPFSTGGMLTNLTWGTLLPVTLNAFGGVVVGLVTKYSGGIVKGFALIAGIIITGFGQWIFDSKPLSQTDFIAVCMVVLSIYLHSSFPINKIENNNKKDLNNDVDKSNKNKEKDNKGLEDKKTK